MRRTLILTLAVLACALAICFFSLSTLNDTVGRAQQLHRQAMLAAEGDDADRAAELLARLAGLWADRAGLMEMLASHDALHDVGAAIAEARICLECRDHDDFLRTMSTAQRALDHLRFDESLCWQNLY